METRSRKSRSRTPFSVEKFSQEFLDKESLAENSVRVTRSITTYQVKESATNSFDEVTSTNKVTNKSIDSESNKWYKTSDYSSEEGENEVSSSRNISQNEKNQIIEDARAAANGGSDVSALNLYKRSGRYWEIYPKTDYTYSPQSKDRVEIAPGVVAMPNMSRRNIHSVHSSDVSSSFTDVEHKQTNTESYLLKSASDLYANYVPRQLFNNNYEHNYLKRSSSSSKSVSLWSRTKTTVVSTFTRIVTVITSILYFGFRTQTSLQSKLHKWANKVMLLDTWLLWKNNPGNKSAKLIALCIIPLVLLGGWWLFSNLSSSSLLRDSSDEIIINTPIQNEEFLKKEEEIQIEKHFPPIDINGNGILVNQQKLIDDLKEEITNLRIDIMNAEKTREDDLNRFMASLQSEKLQNNVQIIYRVNRCCKNPIIDMEKYVNRILISLINDPDFLKNQKGLTDYLHTIFAARQELELRLNYLTSDLDSKHSNLIQASTLKLMDEITTKIKLEMSKSKKHTDYGSVDISNVSDDRVKGIVWSILALYDADKTGLVDYAMESMGAQILSTRCTENYHYGKAVVSVLGIPLWYPVNSPRTLITPGISPGQCWAFQNFPGFVMIRLSKRVKVEAFSVEHISRLLVPNGEIDSAPKQFEVYGLKDEYDKEPILLGEYEYDYNGESLQFFNVPKEDQIFEIIELRIISNHGNPNYTCLYRFRVHGKSV